MAKVEHIEELETPTLWLTFANVAHMRGVMLSETSYFVLYGHSFRDMSWACSGAGGAIAASLNVTICSSLLPIP